MTAERFNYLTSKKNLSVEEYMELNTVGGDQIQVGNIAKIIAKACPAGESKEFTAAIKYLISKSRKYSELVSIRIAHQCLNIIRHIQKQSNETHPSD